jgi:uncharacterized membrane protein
MHRGMCIALIAMLTVLFSLYLMKEHIQDLMEQYRVRIRITLAAPPPA